MAQVCKTAFLCVVMLAELVSCRTKITPLSPPVDPIRTESTCKAPSIEKNIVGTWRFKSTYDPENPKSGIISFNSEGVIDDPNELFQNVLDVGPVTSKTYKPQAYNPYKQPSVLFEIYQNTKRGPTIVFFAVVSNECDKIILGLIGSPDHVRRITLTR